MVGFILDEGEIYWLSMGILVAALSIIAASIVFGRILYQDVTKKFLDYLKMFEDPTKLFDTFREFLERTNEFWTTYGQIALATFIVAILAVLLLTRTVSQEAGLPILSAISGFAIAKGASINRSLPPSQSRSHSSSKSPEGNDKGKGDGDNGSGSPEHGSLPSTTEKIAETVSDSSIGDNKTLNGSPLLLGVIPETGKITEYTHAVVIDGSVLYKRGYHHGDDIGELVVRQEVNKPADIK